MTLVRDVRVLAVIPGYEEGPRIGAVVRSASRHLQVLVVDDGSADDTAAQAEAAGARVVGLFTVRTVVVVTSGNETGRTNCGNERQGYEAFTARYDH